MKVSKLGPQNGLLQIQVDEEDTALGDIIHHELLMDERGDFAGSVRSHPLIKRFTIGLRTKGADPKEVLLACCEKAVENTLMLLKEIEKAVV
ncbi:MAG: RpoL/Rpb11 RNA polymerase subunit family protein [Nitrososphaerota archaeon]